METRELNAAMDAAAHAADRRARARSALMADFQIKSAYVGVPTLARVLGLATSTIYSLMRLGTFCLPHRMVGSTVLVRLDDLVEWHCATDVESLATADELRAEARDAQTPKGHRVAG